MTRHRKGLRPLSQRGLNRIPHNPKQRNFSEGGIKVARASVLDDYNETLTGATLHPTKGFRVINFQRLVAQTVIAQITFREPKAKRGPTPNRYMPHIGAKQRARLYTGQIEAAK